MTRAEETFAPARTSRHPSARARRFQRLHAGRTHRRRTFMLALVAFAGLAAVAGQLVRHGATLEPEATLAAARPLASGWARPDMIDRNGHLLATDTARPSLFADPALIVDVDEVVAFLSPIFPEIAWREMRDRLDDRKRRFVWIKRTLSPRRAARVEALGLPGLAFRDELHRRYPMGAATSHVVGTVDIDNRGQSGVETFVQDVSGVDVSDSAKRSARAPVRLTLDVGVQHVLRSELIDAQRRTRSKASAGIVMNARTGAIVAAVSLPDFDPLEPQDALAPDRLNRLVQGRYELGSVFKPLTLAAALDAGTLKPRSRIDTRNPIEVAGHIITDPPAKAGLLTAEQIFLHSSNVGVARIAADLGGERLTGFLARVGLTNSLQTALGDGATPLVPTPWRDVNTMTASYGHGLAVTPLQFAAASATLINGGLRVHPHVVTTSSLPKPTRIVSKDTSHEMRRMFRRNVVSRDGTGARAAAPGYVVGGKTGTADQPGETGYDQDRVISSFIAGFPMSAPKYVTYVMLFEPQIALDGSASRSAAKTAAPLTGKLISRIAPMLGLAPQWLASDG